jgi:enamine deaminase RidA (YjgF/YER057c/UK114 family)
MAGRIDARLAALGIELPPPRKPVATYVAFTRTGDQVWISGQGPTWNQEVRYRGKLGRELDLEQGRAAARLTALNLLAHLRVACDGDLDRVTRCVKLFGLVNSAPDFTEQPKVIDGASELMVEIFGDAGRHSRAAVAAPALPLSIAVELDAIFTIS